MKIYSSCRKAYVAKLMSQSLCRKAYVAKLMSQSLCRKAYVAKLIQFLTILHMLKTIRKSSWQINPIYYMQYSSNSNS